MIEVTIAEVTLTDNLSFGLDAVFPAALLAIIGNLLRTAEGMAAAVAGGLICLVLLPVAPAGVKTQASLTARLLTSLL